MEVWCCGNFEDKFRSGRRLGIEVGIEVLGEDVDEVDDTVGHGLSG